MSGFGYYLVEAFVKHRNGVWVGVARSGCGFTYLLYIVHCIEYMYKRAEDLFAVELVDE